MENFVYPSKFTQFALPILSFNSRLVGLESFAFNSPDVKPYLDRFNQSIQENADNTKSFTFEIEFPNQKDHFLSVIFLVNSDFSLLSYFVSFYSKVSK